ncbi:hypothetical protein [Brevibacillus laterosporus]|uniref:hypothetical protein n=1 Tax=Brevibacillus laterosporus TaxID=1465 RepID=UPI000CE3C7E0|nr:hypothetical protein [Brevibacillus laterosporus]MBG9772632.1 hypothetical protein [Brevibacillus laterosporus]PPA81910.1 hypothetical protein C4A75_20975 [Brevibacillus laterosporus]
MMNALEQLVDQINLWSERLLLKGLAKINDQDMQEVKQFIMAAQQLDMKFLVQLLERIEAQGKAYVRNSREDIIDVTQSYFYLCQYMEFISKETSSIIE